MLNMGVIRPLQGKIETLISRNERNRQLMTVSTVKEKNQLQIIRL